MLKGTIDVISNITPFPKNNIDKTVPVAAETNKGTIEAAVKSTINTSMAKTIAATGALKTAAIAAVQPQAKRRVVFLVFKLKSLDKLDPIAEPVNTIGASNPTEPPKPTVSELATIDEYTLCPLNLPLLLEIDLSTMLTPWLMLSRMILETKKMVSNIPISGNAK